MILISTLLMWCMLSFQFMYAYGNNVTLQKEICIVISMITTMERCSFVLLMKNPMECRHPWASSKSTLIQTQEELQLRILLAITSNPPKRTVSADNLDSHRLSVIVCTQKKH